jgi:hypothetical protein
VRLRQEKIDSLARKVARALGELNRLELVAPSDGKADRQHLIDQVEGAVRRVIVDDLRREDELEKEAEQILKQHQQRILRQNLSYNTLLAKTKAQLARERKIIL